MFDDYCLKIPPFCNDESSSCFFDSCTTTSLQQHRWLQGAVDIQEASKDAEALAASVVSSFFLFTLIFGLSGTVDIRHVKQEFKNYKGLVTGLVMQFFIMPLLGFAVVKALQNQGLSQAMGVTLLVVTASPGGSFSNWWCSTFNADLALSVAMTTISTLFSMGLLPANLMLYSWAAYGTGDQGGVWHALDLRAIFASLAIVIFAIGLGLFMSWYMDSPKFHKIANHIGTVSGLLLIAVSIALSTGEEGTNFWDKGWTFYVGVAFPCVIGLILANAISLALRLKKPESMAIAIECCYQNVGIATTVAVNMFDGPDRAEALAVPLFYGFVEAMVIIVYCFVCWKIGWTKAPRNEKLCVIVTHTYELQRHDDEEEEEEEEEEEDDGRVELSTSQEEEEEEKEPPHGLARLGAFFKAWWNALFEPRFPDYGQEPQDDDGDEDDESFYSCDEAQDDVEEEPEYPADDLEANTSKKNGGERNRFVSEDNTATTKDLTPPNTPGAGEEWSSGIIEEEEVEVQA